MKLDEVLALGLLLSEFTHTDPGLRRSLHGVTRDHENGESEAIYAFAPAASAFIERACPSIRTVKSSR